MILFKGHKNTVKRISAYILNNPLKIKSNPETSTSSNNQIESGLRNSIEQTILML